ncbi:hypothetical protein DH2020_011107 [Rehmannia glutinosa]|uniref:Peroxidase n=1 Tax=Rehmannia glutinosa TaxID=99300 RepID=A0ABR0XCE8_REHGL
MGFIISLVRQDLFLCSRRIAMDQEHLGPQNLKWPPLDENIVLIRYHSYTSLVALSHGQGTRVGFYSRTCFRAESIVQSTVRTHFSSNRAIAPGLLRMHFHDCFVQGCDGSILIDGEGTEKTAGPNLLLRGYDVIEDAKRQLETACPGVVSCADILALAARDSVVLAGGPGWAVPTGRRDGRVSLASDASNLPGFTDSVDVQIQKFENKGLNTQDLVTLVGKQPNMLNVITIYNIKNITYGSSIPDGVSSGIRGHTIGTTACQFFRYRLYNFTSTGGADPSIDPAFLPTLQSLCPADGDGSRRVGLDNGSENRFDNGFFAKLRDGRGVLESDQKLWTDGSTRDFVRRYLGVRGLLGLTFSVEFGRSMVKMSNIEVKTGSNGEIRRSKTDISS